MKRKRLVWIVGLVLALLAAPVNVATEDVDTGKSGLLFVENVGQFDARARFQVQGGPATLWLTEDALWVTLVDAPLAVADLPTVSPVAEPRRAVNLKLSFVDANPHPRVEPFNRLDSVMHYYRGSDTAEWHTDVPVWGGVRYIDLYPSVDLEITGEAARLTWRLVCRADCDALLQQARLRVEGSETVTVEDDHLRLDTELGPLDLPLLEVTGRDFTQAPAVTSTTGNGIEIARPFFAAPLTAQGIDAQVTYPEEAYFGSYLGGSSDDWVYDIAVSGQGDILDRGSDSRAIWVAGWTRSNNFPTEPGTTSLNGSFDGFVTKLKRSALYVAPTFSVYIGGSDVDAVQAIATDADGNAYVTGWTTSGDFPTTGNAFDQTHNACTDCVQCNSQSDGFVMKFDSSGTVLYSSYLGGSHFYTPGYGNSCGYDRGHGIAVGAEDLVYLTGMTRSDNFPTTAGAYDTDFSYEPIGLNEDTFVVKLDLSAGAAGLRYGTFIGGGNISRGEEIAVDDNGDIYVTGYAQGYMGLNYFPTTPGAYITGIERGTVPEAFIVKLHPGGNGNADLLYSTFLGTTTSFEYGEGIALDATGHVYVIGSTNNPDFPVTAGAFDTTCGTDGTCNGGYADVFISKVNPGGNGDADLLYSTFLGGKYQDEGADIALGTNGDVYVTGRGVSEGFPITPDAYSDNVSEYFDAFVTRLRPQGQGASDLVYSTAVGSPGNDKGLALTLDEDDRVYVAGETLSSNFPTTDHALYDYYSGQTDAFIFRLLAPPPPPDLSTSTKNVVPNTATVGEIVTYTLFLRNSGMFSATVAVTDTLSAALLLQGNPAASDGNPPTVTDQTITWTGVVNANAAVELTYAAQVTVTGDSTLVPPVINRAYIDDGMGNVYVRQALVNGYEIFLPLVLR